MCDTRHKEGRGEALVILVVWTRGEWTDERTGGLSEGERREGNQRLGC